MLPKLPLKFRIIQRSHEEDICEIPHFWSTGSRFAEQIQEKCTIHLEHLEGWQNYNTEEKSELKICERIFV